MGCIVSAYSMECTESSAYDVVPSVVTTRRQAQYDLRKVAATAACAILFVNLLAGLDAIIQPVPPRYLVVATKSPCEIGRPPLKRILWNSTVSIPIL